MSIQGTSKLMWCIEFVVSWTYNLSRKESEIFFIGCLAVKIMQNELKMNAYSGLGNGLKKTEKAAMLLSAFLAEKILLL